MKTMINGVRFNVEKCGDGFPLLLLHGFTGAASTWKPFCPIWGKHSLLVMVDMIGHGLTDSPEMADRYDVLRAANDLKVLLDEMGSEKTDLLGYSMGGRVAITFASLYPDMVRKLVLESTTPGLKSESEKNARIQQDYNLASKIEEGGLENFIDYWESIPLFQSQLNLPADVREQIRSQRLQNNPVGLANSLRGMGTGAQPSWWDKLHRFDFETLLVTGTMDSKFCNLAEEMSSKLPNARHLSIKECGHAIHVEEPEKFGTIVSEFLSNT
jgi:2-succinyl-6-hydroxy-2,4-cyclohexadiene-1-carboxylate synthase